MEVAMLSSRGASSFIFMILVAILLPQGAAGQILSRPTQESDSYGCGELRLMIRDEGGRPISGAAVRTESGMVMSSDSTGWIEVATGNLIHLPMHVEVDAQGYKSRQAYLGPTDCQVEIGLERVPTNSSYAPTISADELRPDVQKQSMALQQQAEKAMRAKDYVAVEHLLHQALELTPSSSGIYNNIGVAFLRMGNLDQAAEWFEKAVRLAPFDPLLTGNLGLTRWLQHRTDESRRLLSTAVARGYSVPSAHYILGVTALGRGHDREAIRELSKVGKNYPYRDLFLAVALGNTGKSSKAHKELRDFFRRYPAPLLMMTLGTGSGPLETAEAGDQSDGSPLAGRACGPQQNVNSFPEEP
jgi:Tfp pilus assembly protein PilF